MADDVDPISGLKGFKHKHLPHVHGLYKELLDQGLLPDHRVAVDVGAHVGAWTVSMARDFKTVWAFEPGEAAFGMLVENTAKLENVFTAKAALGNVDAMVTHRPPRPKRWRTLTCYQTFFDEPGNTKAATLDSYKLDEVDFLKIDVEGAEKLVLDGALDTIERNRPLLCVEIWGLAKQYGITEQELKKFIRSLGYEQVFKSGVDHIFKPR